MLSEARGPLQKGARLSGPDSQRTWEAMSIHSPLVGKPTYEKLHSECWAGCMAECWVLRFSLVSASSSQLSEPPCGFGLCNH